MRKRQCLYAERSCYRPDMNITRKRPSKHERLLKALLKCVVVMTDNGQVFVSMGRPRLTEKQAFQLIAIKQAMEKKGAKV